MSDLPFHYVTVFSVSSSNLQAIIALESLPFSAIAYFDAPPKFLGNKRFSYGQTLSFNLRLERLSLADTLVSMTDGDVVFKGQSLRAPIVAALPHLPTGEFQTFTVSST